MRFARLLFVALNTALRQLERAALELARCFETIAP
jgi:hypothetical protein